MYLRTMYLVLHSTKSDTIILIDQEVTMNISTATVHLKNNPFTWRNYTNILYPSVNLEYCPPYQKKLTFTSPQTSMAGDLVLRKLKLSY